MSRKISDFFKSTPKGDEVEKKSKSKESNARTSKNKFRKCFVALNDISSHFCNQLNMFEQISVFDSNLNLKKLELETVKSQKAEKCKIVEVKEESEIELKITLDQIKEIKMEIIIDEVHSSKINTKRLFVKSKCASKSSTDDNICMICGRKLSSKYRLASHMKNIHLRKTNHQNGQNKYFECDFDGKSYKTKGNLIQHMGIHLPFLECQICHKMLRQRRIDEHMKNVHATDLRFQCNTCSKRFKSAMYLKIHEKGHNKKCECLACGKKFTTMTHLNEHKKQVHENPKGFECQTCEKTFGYKSNLKSHQKLHDKNYVKRFKCQRCGLSTEYQKDLIMHQKSHERLDKKYAAIKNPLKCEKCPTFHRNKYFLTSHMKHVHPEILFQCDLCAKFLKIKSNLIRHLKTHILKNSKKLEKLLN